MKKYMLSILLGSIILGSGAAVQARDTKLILPIKDALNYSGKKSSAAEVLDPDIKLVFGYSNGGKIIEKDVVSNKKTNAFNKSDEEACHWAFLSAVKAFQQRAKSMNATTVVNLVSYYKKNGFKSRTEYECHAGAVIAGVALKGDIAK